MNCTWCHQLLELTLKDEDSNYCEYYCLNTECSHGTILYAGGTWLEDNELCRYISCHFYLNQFIYVSGSLQFNFLTIKDYDNNTLIKVPFVKLSLKNYVKESEDLIKRLMKLQVFT